MSRTPIRIWKLATLLAVTLTVADTNARAQDEKKPHPLIAAIKITKGVQAKLEKVGDYQCDFSKTEVVGRRRVSQQMRLKVRNKPFSVYMYFKKPHQGREVIYVAGRNNNKLAVHETGYKALIGTLNLPPTDARAMEDNRHPITEIGLHKMLDITLAQWEKESKYGECEVKYYPSANIGNLKCKVIESTHPTPRRQFAYHKTRLWISKETGLPVRIEQFGFPPRGAKTAPLIEQYTYLNVRANPGLTNRDFDVNNPAYRF